MYIVKFNNRTESACSSFINVAISYATQVIRDIKLADQAIIFQRLDNGTLKAITHIDKI